MNDLALTGLTTRCIEKYGEVWVPRTELIAWLAKSEAASEHPHARQVLKLVRERLEELK